MTETPETARHLLDRYGLPEDVIDGALALFAQELAGKIRAWHDTLPGEHLCCDGNAAELISPENWARVEALTPPAVDQAPLVEIAAQAIRDSNGTPEAVEWWRTHPQLIPAHVYAAAVLAVLPAPADRAAVLGELIAKAEEWDGHITVQELRRMAAEARDSEQQDGAQPVSCAHCGKTIRCITGTLTAWWVHIPGGQAMCKPWQPARSTRATPKPAAEAQQDGAQS